MDSDNQPVIVKVVRSPMCKARKGFLAKERIEAILYQLIEGLLKDTGIKKEQIDEMIIGNVLGIGCGFIEGRAAQALAGLPETVPYIAVHRMCSSGIDSIVFGANAIAMGQAEIVIAGGVESMSNAFYHPIHQEIILKEWFDADQKERDLTTSMGMTNENICAKYGITREQQDEFAYKSHMKAFKADQAGVFKKEIIPIKRTDGQICDHDETIRGTTSMEVLAGLKPCFKKDGITTAGSSSPLTDGGAIALIVTRKIAKELNLPVLCTIRAYKKIGCDPAYMGIGPSIAIPKVLEMAGLKLEDIDAFEINEAFAGQAKYCIEKVGIPYEKVNIHGGALSMGHPLGCSGARLLCSLLNVLEEMGKKRGILSMCVGTGEGVACIIERP